MLYSQYSHTIGFIRHDYSCDPNLSFSVSNPQYTHFCFECISSVCSSNIPLSTAFPHFEHFTVFLWHRTSCRRNLDFAIGFSLIQLLDVSAELQEAFSNISLTPPSKISTSQNGVCLTSLNRFVSLLLTFKLFKLIWNTFLLLEFSHSFTRSFTSHTGSICATSEASLAVLESVFSTHCSCPPYLRTF